MFNFDPNPFERTTFWGMTIGQAAVILSRFGVSQKFVQRFLAIEKQSDIRKAILLVCIGWVSMLICCILTGLIVYAKYHDCDPLSANLVKRNDQTLPYYVMDVAENIHGLPGIFLAGLVSSAMSTMSASLNSLPEIIYEDFVDQWIKESPNKDAKSANIMKLISVLIGLITIALIFMIERLGTIFEMVNSLGSIVDGPLLGLFVLGMLFPWVGKKGAMCGGICALTTMTWIISGSQWHILNKRITFSHLPTSAENCQIIVNETQMIMSSVLNEQHSSGDSVDEPLILFRLSFLHFILVGSLITVVIGLLTSLACGESDLSEIDPKHVAPCMRRFLPEKVYKEVPLKDITQEKATKEYIIKS